MSFDQHDPAFIEDPERVFGPIRNEHPVLHSDRYGGFWLLTRYEDVTAAALDCDALTSAVPGTTLIPPTQPRTYPLLPLELDPPEHTQYRALVNPLFAKPRIESMRPSLEALATRLLEPFARNGGGDVMADFAHPMSLGSLARLMDLPEDDEPRWFDWVERMYSNAILDAADHAEAAREAEAYIDELVEARKREPSDDFIGLLLRAEVDGHGLSDAEVRQFGMVMLLAGYETTSGAMGMSLLHLAQQPGLRAQLFGAPRADHPGRRRRAPGVRRGEPRPARLRASRALHPGPSPEPPCRLRPWPPSLPRREPRPARADDHDRALRGPVPRLPTGSQASTNVEAPR
jgi:cytochrome P450